jgi:hypothetical protein
MRTLRSTWSRHGLVALLVTTLLPLVLGPLADRLAEGDDARAQWLRAQVSVMPDDARTAFETALDRAQDTAGPSLEAFTTVFAEAYVAQSPSVALSAVFDVSAPDEQGLYRALHQRSQQLGRSATVPLRLTAPSSAPATTPVRMLSAAGPAVATAALTASWQRVHPLVERLPARLVHFLCAVQPLGP